MVMSEGQLRYEQECKMLYTLAKRQLNLPKNRAKEDFEDMDLDSILVKLMEEVGELIKEFKNKPLLLSKTYLEIGDISAVMVGLIAYINKYQGDNL
jgi:NTP pyrophosphatase (non-canonical NTP hydrolase)